MWRCSNLTAADTVAYAHGQHWACFAGGRDHTYTPSLNVTTDTCWSRKREERLIPGYGMQGSAESGLWSGAPARCAVWALSSALRIHKQFPTPLEFIYFGTCTTAVHKLLKRSKGCREKSKGSANPRMPTGKGWQKSKGRPKISKGWRPWILQQFMHYVRARQGLQNSRTWKVKHRLRSHTRLHSALDRVKTPIYVCL